MLHLIHHGVIPGSWWDIKMRALCCWSCCVCLSDGRCMCARCWSRWGWRWWSAYTGERGHYSTCTVTPWRLTAVRESHHIINRSVCRTLEFNCHIVNRSVCHTLESNCHIINKSVCHTLEFNCHTISRSVCHTLESSCHITNRSVYYTLETNGHQIEPSHHK